MKKTIKILCILTLGPWLLGAAEKVASLSPALTQMVLLLNGGSALCGRSSACYFPEVSGVPVVGDLGRPFPEAVLQSRATVVICDTLHPEANWAILQRCGVKIECFTTANIAELPGNLRRLGRLLGREEAAETLAADVENKIAALRAQAPAHRLRALVVFGVEPVISCGADVFISDVLELSGVDNIASGAGQGYFILNAEYIYRENPDLILIIGIPEKVVQETLQHGLLRRLPAIRQNRIIYLDAGSWSRLTPEIIDAAIELRHQLH